MPNDTLRQTSESVTPMSPKKWYLAGIGAAVFVSLYSAYATAFFAWLTATPLSPAQLKRSQFDTYAWFCVLCISVITVIALTLKLWCLGKKDRRMRPLQTPAEVTSPASTPVNPLTPHKMKLIETIRLLATLDSDATIYATHPWSTTSDAGVAVEGTDEERKLKTEGLRYFLEVSIAQDFLSDWKKTRQHPPTDEQCCKRLVEYAANDA